MGAKTTRVGVAWSKQTQDGNGLISVVITNPVGPDFKFTLWPVREKRSDTSPDYDVTKQADNAPAYQPQGQGQAAAPASRRGTSYIPPGADSANESEPGGDEAPWEG